ncbi:MAG: aspartate aminotransferase family protein [Acidimicrobiia bacterium]|nr:aspartate aminotransferase family protein [Acidimicrobiia bacterium]
MKPGQKHTSGGDPLPSAPELPTHGWSTDETLERLEALRRDDVRWKDGRVFSLAYFATPEAHDLATEAYRRFSGENALNVDAFPSLRVMQGDVLAIVARWLAAPASARGFFTSGGTESILMAVKAARDQFRHDKIHPNVVLSASAHAAFEKAGAYFGVELRRVDARDDWRADARAMRAVADDQTVMFVASAPQYPQGVVDPVAEIAALALERGVNCHVDACMGGVTLPYLERLGVPVTPWHFSVEGVTSISVDLHKFGYTAKGASVIMYRTSELRSHQAFVTDNWLGGFYGSSGVLGTKSGGPIAAAWAVLHHLGDDGYLRVTREARDTASAIADHVRAHPQLTLRAEPDATLVCIGAAPNTTLDIFAVADALATRGWYVDRQQPPPSIHLTVNAVHARTYREFLIDLDAAVDEVAERAAKGTAGAYGTLE